MTTAFLVLFLGFAPAGDGEALTLPEYFAVFAPLVGHTWVAEFPGGASMDTQRFEWVYGGKFLRNTHSVTNNGKEVYAGETIYAWDHREKRLVWWYWNTTGGHLTGTITPKGNRFLVEGVNNAPAGQTDKVRSEMVMEKESWQSVQYFWKDGEWKNQGSATYRKQ